MFVGIKAETKDMKPFSEIESRLDEGIKEAVRVLREGGICTFESCEGGEAHAYPEPTVAFRGGPETGALAYAIATYHGLPVAEIRRCWRVYGYELEGPYWEITFYRKLSQKAATSPKLAFQAHQASHSAYT
ncbi:MAG: hypothetical protein ACLQPD_33025 [Desulfomonilaceae bacterium]